MEGKNNLPENFIPKNLSSNYFGRNVTKNSYHPKKIFHQNNTINGPKTETTSMPKLFINSKLPEIANAIKNSMITIINLQTGSGKTIGIPNYLSQDNFYKNIFCSLPTIAATISAARYQSKILTDPRDVGYACEGNKNYDYNTKIIYCTTGHLLNQIIRAVSGIYISKTHHKWFTSLIILDEFHTRSKESDICLCLWIFSYKQWKENPDKYPHPPKLVIMSATLDDGVKKLLPTEPSVLSYKMDAYPIQIIYDNDINQYYKPDDDALYLRAAELVKKYHKDGYGGDYLVFVPGKYELDLIQTELEMSLGSEVEIYPAHGDLSVDELVKIHEPPKKGIRKIVIATNILEYSITIEGISLVIDTMVHREASSELDESLKLDLFWIPKTNSKQRMGRTGRTCPGIYVPMISEQRYALLEDNITPEIQRISISYDILKLMKFGLDPKIIFAPVIDGWQIDLHVDLLVKLGFVISKNQKENLNVISDMGDFCSQFPLSIRKSAMLYHLHHTFRTNNFLHLAVICTLNCYGSGIFYLPRKKKTEDKLSYQARLDDVREKISDKYAGYSDVDTIFKIWIDICSNIYPFYLKDLNNYCFNNNLNFRRFKETVILLKQCIHVSNRLKFNVSIDRDPQKFRPPPMKNLSNTFYELLKLTHQEYITTVYYNGHGNVSGNCCGFQHKIDNRSIHTMEPGNNIRQIFYALIRTQRTIKKGYIARFINVMHSIPSANEEEQIPSIFSSDAELDPEPNKQSSQNWNKLFLQQLESKMFLLDPDLSNSSDSE